MWWAWPPPCKPCPLVRSLAPCFCSMSLLWKFQPVATGIGCCTVLTRRTDSRVPYRGLCDPQAVWRLSISASTRKAQEKEGAKARSSFDDPKWHFHFLLALCLACACLNLTALKLIILLSKASELSCTFTQEPAFATCLPASHHGGPPPSPQAEKVASG